MNAVCTDYEERRLFELQCTYILDHLGRIHLVQNCVEVQERDGKTIILSFVCMMFCIKPFHCRPFIGVTPARHGGTTRIRVHQQCLSP